MRKLFYVIALCPLFCFSQDVVYSEAVSKSGDFWNYESGIVTIHIDGNSNTIANVDSVQIEKFKKSYRFIYDQMIADGIAVSFSNTTYTPKSNDDSLNGRMIRFADQRNTGFILEVSGMGVATIGAIATLTPVAVLGGVVAVVGYIVKWTAGKHLRRH